MKTSTKNKVLQVLQENLNKARSKKSEALSKLRSCEQNIKWGKKSISKNDKTFSGVQCFIKNNEYLEYVVLFSVKKEMHKTLMGLKINREELVSIKNDLSASKREISKWSDLINEVSPYKKY